MFIRNMDFSSNCQLSLRSFYLILHIYFFFSFPIAIPEVIKAQNQMLVNEKMMFVGHVRRLLKCLKKLMIFKHLESHFKPALILAITLMFCSLFFFFHFGGGVKLV